MANTHHHPSSHYDDSQHRLSSDHYAGKSSTSTIVATFAALAIGSPLLGLSACILIATTALLAAATLPLLLFSPIIVPAALIILAAMTGFGFSALMALTGLTAVAFAFRSASGVLPEGVARKVHSLLMDKGDDGVRAKGLDFGGYLEDKGRAHMLNKA